MSQVNPNTDIKSNSNLLNNGAVDTDIKSDSNLLNNADSVQDVQNKVLTTEVTSIAEQEQITGIQQKIPTADELYSKAMMSFIRNMKHLNDIINYSGSGTGKRAISRKGMNRVLNSILQLPMDGMPVTLQGELEKNAFVLGQRVIADRYIITHHHIIQERKRLQDEKNNATVTNNEQQTVAEEKGE